MCWELKGKPPFGRNNNTQQRYVVRGSQTNITLVDDKPGQDSTSSSSKINILQKKEIEKLQSFLTSLDKPVGSCSLAHSGKYSSSQALSVSKDYNLHGT
ncbi:hypothetical protein ACSBR2_017289 [Camellia fascicularis]